MNYEMMNNNRVYLQGTIEDEPVFNHEAHNEKFYNFDLRVKRLSGQDDILPITISEKLMNGNMIKGEKLALVGQFRSYNKIIDGRSRLILSIFCRELCEWNDEANPNVIELSGFICKSPIFRTTPFAREICDLLLAVNRSYDKSDYIPCIAWGRNAQFVSKLPVGTRLEAEGRIQSREYNKKVDNENGIEVPITKIAYEVSISSLAVSGNEDMDEM